ncbi:hypothetical protein DVA81_19315, partial [Acinetobacter baumannii]
TVILLDVSKKLHIVPGLHYNKQLKLKQKNMKKLQRSKIKTWNQDGLTKITKEQIQLNKIKTEYI